MSERQIVICSKRGGVSPVGYRRIDVTSHAKDVFRQCSPFVLGPIPLYGGFTSKNMENAWQYAKLYRQFADDDGNPTDAYYQWARAGWDDRIAHRYPMGKLTPLCSIWDGRKLSYEEARRVIFVPCYCKAVVQTEAFRELSRLCAAGDKLCLLDFDGYDPDELGYTMEDILSDGKRILGHALLIKALLEGIDKKYIEQV